MWQKDGVYLDFLVFAELKMDAATASVVGSSIGIRRPARSVSGSAFLSAQSPDFVRFGAKSQFSIKVRLLLSFDFR